MGVTNILFVLGVTSMCVTEVVQLSWPEGTAQFQQWVSRLKVQDTDIGPLDSAPSFELVVFVLFTLASFINLSMQLA